MFAGNRALQYAPRFQDQLGVAIAVADFKRNSRPLLLGKVANLCVGLLLYALGQLKICRATVSVSTEPARTELPYRLSPLAK
jgi:hypothetical protein